MNVLHREICRVLVVGASVVSVWSAADVAMGGPRDAPADLQRLIDAGNVKFEFYNPIKDPKKFAGHAKFHISVQTRFSFDFRIAKRNNTRYVRIVPKIQQLKIKIQHTITLPKRLDVSNPWEDPLLHHEFDHVAISADPRIRMLIEHLARGIKVIEKPFPGRGTPKQSALQKIVIDEQTKRRDAVLELIRDRYRLLDKETVHGRKQIGDREIFFKILYTKPSLDEAKFPYLGQTLDLLRKPEYQQARPLFHSSGEK